MTKTQMVMIALTIGILAWDLQLFLNRRKGDTISEEIRKRPLLAFLVGCLVGHWFL